MNTDLIRTRRLANGYIECSFPARRVNGPAGPGTVDRVQTRAGQEADALYLPDSAPRDTGAVWVPVDQIAAG